MLTAALISLSLEPAAATIRGFKNRCILLILGCGFLSKNETKLLWLLPIKGQLFISGRQLL